MRGDRGQGEQQHAKSKAGETHVWLLAVAAFASCFVANMGGWLAPRLISFFFSHVEYDHVTEKVIRA